MKYLLIIIACAVSNSHQEASYCWRDYYGTIPEDAVVAGQNQDGTKVYIGQGYYRNKGLQPGTIIPGVKEVSVHWGAVRQSVYNKILCGPQENFYWMKANSTNLHLLVIEKHAVNGGHDDVRRGNLNIGRIAYGGRIVVGKINSFWVENALMYYNDNGHEKNIKSYEVLMFDKSTKFDLRLGVDSNY